MLFLLTVLDVLELSVHDRVESGLRSVRHLPAGFLFELGAKVDLALLFGTDLQVNSSRYFLGYDVCIALDAVRYSALSLDLVYDAVSGPVGLIQEECTLNLILTLLVARRC